MRTFLLLTSTLLLAGATGVPAQQGSWTGQIGDSRCGATHEEDADAAGGGRQGAPTPHSCTLACVRGGSKYVLVSGDKVYQIADQKNPALETFAGETVRVTGELNGTVLTISKIEQQH